VRDFLRRAAFAVIAIPLAGALIWVGGTPFAALVAVLSGLAAWEFFRLSAAGGVHAFDRAGVTLAMAIPLVVHANHVQVSRVPIGAGALMLLALFAAAVWRRVSERPLSAVGATIFGVLYTGGMLTFGYGLRYHPYVIDAAAGTALVGLPLILTWATDTGAYLFGKAFGKAKLMPAVSPGKTWAGAAGGLALAIVAVWGYVHLVLRPVASLSLTATGIGVFAVLVSATAQVGDLAESLLKREAGVKDSSRLIPGHGGVLDRFDSLLFVLPVSYLLLTELLVATP
jgi:phosphatidate cytidylyltransferase